MRKKQIHLPDATFTELVAKSTTLGQIARALLDMGYGGDITAIKRRIDALNLDISHFKRKFKREPRRTAPRSSWVYYLTEAEFASIAKQVTSFSMFAAAVGRKMGGGPSRDIIRRRAAQLGVSLDHFVYSSKGTIPEKVLVANSPVTFGLHQAQLLEFLLRHKIFEEKCSICGLGTSWFGEPIRLKVFHKNGDSRDLRVENLTILCPNCRSQEARPIKAAIGRRATEARQRTRKIGMLKRLAR